MEFGLSEEQRLLQSSVTGYLRSASALDQVRLAAEANVTCDTKLWAGLAELGAHGIVVPEDYGGVDMGFLEAALIAEALGACTSPVPFLGTAIMAPVALTAAASDEQREHWLPRIAAGESVLGVALSEQTGRRESDGLTLTGDILNGRAMFVIDGMDADAILVGLADGRLCITDVDQAGVQRRQLKTIDRTRSFAVFQFDNAAADVLPGSVNNDQAMRQTINVGRIMLAADTLGAAQTMLDKAIDYAQERKQFNRVIGSFQAVKHMCAEMAAELEPCRSLVWYGAHSVRNVPEDTQAIAGHAKAHLAEVGRFVARTSTEVHGGMGITDLLGLHYWFKRIGLNRQLLGTPERVREEIAVAQGWL